MSTAIALARVLGPRIARTPSGEPIMLSSPPFNIDETTPQQAMADAAQRWMGIVPYEPHWAVMATYRVSEDARAAHEFVFVMVYEPEAARRKELGIPDGCLNPMGTSWYLERITEAATCLS